MKVNYIKCGDCIDLMKDLPDSSINLILTSPPYNMTKRKGGNSDSGRYDLYFDWKPESDYLQWINTIFNSFDRILVKNGVVIFNFSYSIENPALPYKMVSSIVENTNYDLVDTIIWKKNNGMPFPANKQRLSRIWEYVFIFTRKNDVKTFNINKKVVSINKKTNQKYYEVIYNFIEARNNDGTCKLNQATFSSELVCKLLEIYSISDNDIVLDVFMGTGTTAIGCIKSNKNFIGFEISSNQIDYSYNRINELRKVN